MSSKLYSEIASATQSAVATVLARLHELGEEIVTIALVGAGAGLAFGLCSHSKDLAVALAGTAVYFVAILISPLKGLLLWMVTQPLLERYLNISLGAGIPDLSLTRLCIAFITVLLIARATIRLQRLQPLNKFDLLAFAFLVGLTQAGFRGSGGISSFQLVFDNYFVPVLVYFAVKNLVTDRQSMHWIFYAVLCIAVYSAVYAFYEMATGNVFFVDADKHQFYHESGLRILRGIWGGNAEFGRVFVVSIPILFYFYLKTSSPSRKLLWAVCLALVFGGLYFTYKRTAWIAAVAVTFLMQFFYPQFRRLFVVLLVTFVLAFAFNKDRITESTVYNERVNSKLSTAEDRTEGWENGVRVWSTSPLVGVGWRQYQKRAVEAGYRDVDLESEHVEILVSAGLVGFIPYVGLLILMVRDGYRHYRGQVAGSLADPDLIAVFWGVIVGYVITVATAQVNNPVVIAIPFAVTGAVVYARRGSASTRPEMGERSASPVSSTA